MLLYYVIILCFHIIIYVIILCFALQSKLKPCRNRVRRNRVHVEIEFDGMSSVILPLMRCRNRVLESHFDIVFKNTIICAN